VNSRSRSLYVVVRPSVVCLSVCNVRAPYSGDWNFRQYFYIVRKIIYPSFLRRRMVGGGDPFYV